MGPTNQRKTQYDSYIQHEKDGTHYKNGIYTSPAETPQGKTESGVRIKAKGNHSRGIQLTLQLNCTTEE